MFGATALAVSTVEASLRAEGLTPGPLSANHLTLPVTATATQFAGAFSTGFDQYQLSTGRIAFANTTAPLFQGPAAQYVSAVVGLDTLATPQPIGPAQAAKRLVAGVSPRIVTGGPQQRKLSRRRAGGRQQLHGGHEGGEKASACTDGEAVRPGIGPAAPSTRASGNGSSQAASSRGVGTGGSNCEISHSLAGRGLAARRALKHRLVAIGYSQVRSEARSSANAANFA